MLCPLCAKENKDDAKFCGNCGGPVGKDSSGDSLDDVLGLSLPKSPSSGAQPDLGLDDLFQNLSKKQGAVPAPASEPPAQRRPDPVPKSAKPAGRLTIEDIISSVPEQAVNPPTSAEEARKRAEDSGQRPPAAASGGTPAPMPGGPANDRGERRETRLPGLTGGAPLRPPPGMVGLQQQEPEVLAAAASAASTGRIRKICTVLACLVMTVALGEIARHLVFQSMARTGLVLAACAAALVFAGVVPHLFDSRHVAKALLLGLCVLSVGAYQRAETLSQKQILFGQEAGVVLEGVIVAVFVLGGLTFFLSERLPRPVQLAGGALGLACSATLVDALSRLRPFEDVLAGRGLASQLPAQIAWLEPCWLGVNGLLAAALILSFFEALLARQEGNWAGALSMALSTVILFGTARFGSQAFEARGRPGLRSAMASLDQTIRNEASARGVALPTILGVPGKAPVPTR